VHFIRIRECGPSKVAAPASFPWLEKLGNDGGQVAVRGEPG
jgi:hypothetical protein